MRVGIDIGGMSVKIGIVNEKNDILQKKVIPTDAQNKTQEQIADTMAQAVCELVKESGSGLSKCESVGIACPGTVDAERGIVLYSNNLHWENLALIDIMKRYIQAPMGLANDADAAALGEVVAGAAKGRKNAVLLTLGTGVGGGVILEGKIFSGGVKGGCEPGHMVIRKNGKKCTCGRKGCLEQYASASALMEMGRKAIGKNVDSLMFELCGGDISALRGEHIFEAAKRKDAPARKVISKYEENLSIGIANLVNIFRPEVVILGGGVSAQGENLTRDLQEKVGEMCFGGNWGEIPPIVTSKLGNDAGILGAANLCS